MLTASQFLDRLGKVIRGLGPAPARTWVQVTEMPGETPNWFASVTKPLPYDMAERWLSEIAALRESCPEVDFSDADEDHRGTRGLTKFLVRIPDESDRGPGGRS
jgi:hypothetical protein